MGKSHKAKRNVYFKKKTTSKDTKARAREEEHISLLYIFVVIKRNYKRIILYKMLINDIRKMSIKVYTKEILLAI
jgi:hypothetical protein